MAVEKAKWVPNVAEGLSWTLWNISKTLTDLMNSIMKPINKLLEDLWFKQKTETNNEINKSKIDLKKLMEDVNSDVELNDKLSDKEKTILNWLLEKNKELKDIVERIEEEFWEDTKDSESQLFLSKIKEETDWWSIEEDELKEIIKTMKENKEQIEEDHNLKEIIKIFPSIKNPKWWSDINTIVQAYNDVKEEKEKTNDKIEITTDDVFNKID